MSDSHYAASHVANTDRSHYVLLFDFICVGQQEKKTGRLNRCSFRRLQFVAVVGPSFVDKPSACSAGQSSQARRLLLSVADL